MDAQRLPDLIQIDITTTMNTRGARKGHSTTNDFGLRAARGSETDSLFILQKWRMRARLPVRVPGESVEAWGCAGTESRYLPCCLFRGAARIAMLLCLAPLGPAGALGIHRVGSSACLLFSIPFTHRLRQARLLGNGRSLASAGLASPPGSCTSLASQPCCSTQGPARVTAWPQIRPPPLPQAFGTPAQPSTGWLLLHPSPSPLARALAEAKLARANLKCSWVGPSAPAPFVPPLPSSLPQSSAARR